MFLRTSHLSAENIIKAAQEVMDYQEYVVSLEIESDQRVDNKQLYIDALKYQKIFFSRKIKMIQEIFPNENINDIEDFMDINFEEYLENALQEVSEVLSTYFSQSKIFQTELNDSDYFIIDYKMIIEINSDKIYLSYLNGKNKNEITDANIEESINKYYDTLDRSACKEAAKQIKKNIRDVIRGSIPEDINLKYILLNSDQLLTVLDEA